MIELGLTTAQRAQYFETLRRPHRMRVLTTLLDSSENYVGSISGRVTAGQVVGDLASSVQMSAQLSMRVDDLQRTPRRGDVVRLRREVLTPFGWYGPPLFTGPVDKAVLAGDVLDLDLLCKSSLLRSPVRGVKTYRKGLTRVGVMRDLAYDCGERRFDLPAWTATLGAPLQIRAGKQRWSYIVMQGRSMRGQVFFNGAGAMRLREWPTGTSAWFNESTLTSVPQRVEDDADVVNAVIVKGKPPAGKKTWRIEGRAYIPAWHRLSPQKYGRNGVPRFVWEEIVDETIRTKKDAQAAADRRVRELLAADGSVTFTALPMPGIELGDVQQVSADGVVTGYRLSAFTIPLTHDEPMTVGYTKPLRRRSLKR
ncbi:hypothetical protein EEW87_16350 [Janibacter melonis]|uniref:Uncharacterized protein n=1 Tax=Janibacter melonis TaxID=262209 RepID=A0A650GEE1_9MICO|nr:hypothetical protein [Janibacter melonis]QGX08242.1 hypothetical protein EEW87_16350 [Janibacter melonis]